MQGHLAKVNSRSSRCDRFASPLGQFVGFSSRTKLRLGIGPQLLRAVAPDAVTNPMTLRIALVVLTVAVTLLVSIVEAKDTFAYIAFVNDVHNR